MYQTNGGKVMNNQSKGMNTFQRYLSVWVLICMAIGVLIGHFLVRQALQRSLPL